MAWNIFTVGTVLHAVGNGANDTLHIYDSGKGVVAGNASGIGVFAKANISAIVVDAGNGNDTVTYHLVGDLEANRVRPVTVALRDGNDVFSANFSNPVTGKVSDLLNKSLLQMKVTGEQGNDDLFIDAGGVDMLGGTMKIAFYGGAGDDRIGMTYQGLVKSGGVSFFGYGGTGNDLLRSSLTADPGSFAPAPGGFRAMMYGEDGNDQLLLNIFAPPAVSATQVLLDGGAGVDIGTGNIHPSRIINC